jgi:CubicO group peptidase (beta-lactamase class C family)
VHGTSSSSDRALPWIIERLTGTSWEENVRRRIFTGVMMDAFSDVDNGLFERVAAKS